MNIYSQNIIIWILGCVIIVSIVVVVIKGIIIAFKKIKKEPFSLFTFSILTIVLLIVIFELRYQYIESEIKPFRSHINEYIYLSPDKIKSENGGQIIGKIIPINKTSKDIDVNIYTILPDELRPKNPKEVGTLVWIEYDSKIVGEYSGGGGSAYIRTCDIWVIDKSRRVIIGEKSFEGSYPPIKKAGGGDEYGSYPNDQVLIYLKSLTHK